MAGGNRSGVKATARIRAVLRAFRIPVTKLCRLVAGAMGAYRPRCALDT